MTDKELKKYKQLVRKKTREICRSRKSARNYLIKIGIFNKDGSLSKNYGGTK